MGCWAELMESFEAKLDGVQMREAKNANIISIHYFQISSTCSLCKASFLVDKVVRSVARQSAERRQAKTTCGASKKLQQT